jgi:hypothetical protein
MTRLSIPISDDIKAKLEARAAQSGHPSLESYVNALVLEDAQMIDYGAPDHLRIRSREHLESLVQEGLNSPASEMSASDWDRMRQNLINQNRPSKAG